MSAIAVGAPAAAADARPIEQEDSLPGRLAVRALPGGGELLFYRQPARAVVAIRLSFRLSTTQGPPEALARMAQALAGPELEQAAAPYGARVSLQRTATHASFAITGAASDFPELAAILREKLAWRGWSARQVETTRLAAAGRARQDTETPERLLRLRLAERLFPELPAATDSMPPSLAPATLEAFWTSSFDAAHMQAVVVGAVSQAQAVSALRDWPTPATTKRAAFPVDDIDAAVAGAPEDSVSDDERSTGPQVLFPWAALGWSSEADPAAVAVAARVVQRRRPPPALRLIHVELWWSGPRHALVALGSAAGPSSEAPGTSAWLSAAVSDAAASLTPGEVARARRAVLRDILFSARTPAGLARYLGEMFERTGEPESGQEFLRALDRVDRAAVAAVLAGIGRPVTAEVVP